MNMENVFLNPQFKQALFDVHAKECDQLVELPGEVRFSQKFERKMERLLQSRQGPLHRYVNTNPKKVLLALAATFLLLMALVFGVAAIREPVVRFFVEAYEKFSLVFFHRQQEENYPAVLEVYYAPAWLPAGYQEDIDQRVDVTIYCEWIYVSENEGDIMFTQYIITPSALRVDTEGSQARPILINGNEGVYYSNKGIQNLIWNDGQYGFHIFGPISEAELLQAAESIRAVEME